MTSLVITCADHRDSTVLHCDACKASLHNLKRRARRAHRDVASQAVAESIAMLVAGERAQDAAHRLRLAWRAGIESAGAVSVADVLSLTAVTA